MKLLDTALERVNRDLDLGQVLKNLQELEKLKKIVLNPMQQALFDFVPPPMIRLGKSMTLINPMKAAPDRLSDYLKNYLQYEEIKNANDEISQNLITVLDQDTLNVFHKIEEVLKDKDLRIVNVGGIYHIDHTHRLDALNVNDSADQSQPISLIPEEHWHGTINLSKTNAKGSQSEDQENNNEEIVKKGHEEREILVEMSDSIISM